MLKSSPTAAEYGDVAEEYAIHDFEGFGSYKVEEYAWIPDVVEIGVAIAGHDDPDVLAAWMSMTGEDDPRKAIESFDDAYYGEYESEKDFAQGYAIETGAMSDDHSMFSYVDWDHYWHGEFECEGWRSLHIGGRVFIFSE
jgi:antirestriction protein